MAPNFVVIRGAVDENGKPVLEQPLGERIARDEPQSPPPGDSSPGAAHEAGSKTRPPAVRPARPARCSHPRLPAVHSRCLAL